MTDLSITKRVDEYLRLANVARPPIPILDIAKKAGVRVRFGPMPDELSGFLMYEHGTAILGVNSLHSRRRQAFTIAHELGHHALHPKTNFVDHKILYFRDSRLPQKSDRQEMEANRFAAELLMPAWLLKSLLRGDVVDLEDDASLERMAKNLGVSTQALTFRLVNLNLARATQVRSKA